MKAYTDYPITALGDTPGIEAPVRECEIIAYDGDKCLIVDMGTVRMEIKRGYVYLTLWHYGAMQGMTNFQLKDVWVPHMSDWLEILTEES